MLIRMLSPADGTLSAASNICVRIRQMRGVWPCAGPATRQADKMKYRKKRGRTDPHLPTAGKYGAPSSSTQMPTVLLV
jgi:hypothetical protein